MSDNELCADPTTSWCQGPSDQEVPTFNPVANVSLIGVCNAEDGEARSHVEYTLDNSYSTVDATYTVYWPGIGDAVWTVDAGEVVTKTETVFGPDLAVNISASNGSVDVTLYSGVAEQEGHICPPAVDDCVEPLSARGYCGDEFTEVCVEQGLNFDYTTGECSDPESAPSNVPTTSENAAGSTETAATSDPYEGMEEVAISREPAAGEATLPATGAELVVLPLVAALLLGSGAKLVHFRRN